MSALVLEQLSKSQGRITVYITPTALRLVNRAIGYVIITKAPDWRVFTINDKKNNYFESEYGMWRPPSVIGLDYSTGGAHWKKVASEKISGFNAEKCEVENALREKVGNEEIPRSGIYWVSADAKSAAKVVDLLALYYGVDCLHKIPLRFKAAPIRFSDDMDKHPQAVLFLDTLSSRTELVDSSLFDLPAGHKRVILDADTRMSRKTPKLLNNMLKDMDSIYGRGGR